MVQEPDPDGRRRGFHRLRQLAVMVRGGGVTAGVIVGKNEAANT
jgi:hypothetical protein